jgi:hypothetical protein
LYCPIRNDFEGLIYRLLQQLVFDWILSSIGLAIKSKSFKRSNDFLLYRFIKKMKISIYFRLKTA